MHLLYPRRARIAGMGMNGRGDFCNCKSLNPQIKRNIIKRFGTIVF